MNVYSYELSGELLSSILFLMGGDHVPSPNRGHRNTN